MGNIQGNKMRENRGRTDTGNREGNKQKGKDRGIDKGK